MSTVNEGVTVTSDRSGTSTQAGSSSSGSELTSTPPSRAIQDSVSPHVVAAMTWPLVASKLSRPLRTFRTVSASASGSGAPTSSRPLTTAANMALSIRVSVRVEGGSTAAIASGSTAPLWLNKPPPDSRKGAAPDSSTGCGGVAERTAATTQPEVTVGAREAKERSLQIGCARRNCTGSLWPAAYQPTPYPSALTVPYRCRRGAHDCR